MALPWKVIDKFTTGDEGVLELRQRGKKDFLITVGTQVLMNSMAQRSEMALGELGASHLKDHPSPRVLVGGLGMGITLRAVLNIIPVTAEVIVFELNPHIVTWCQGPLLELTDGAAEDPRVKLKIDDVARGIREASKGNRTQRYDAIILDLYRGPHPKTDKKNDPFYGSRAIEQSFKALNPGGTLAVWGENHDEGFIQRLSQKGFSVEFKRVGKGGYCHAVFLAEKK